MDRILRVAGMGSSFLFVKFRQNGLKVAPEVVPRKPPKKMATIMLKLPVEEWPKGQTLAGHANKFVFERLFISEHLNF